MIDEPVPFMIGLQCFFKNTPALSCLKKYTKSILPSSTFGKSSYLVRIVKARILEGLSSE